MPVINAVLAKIMSSRPFRSPVVYVDNWPGGSNSLHNDPVGREWLIVRNWIQAGRAVAMLGLVVVGWTIASVDVASGAVQAASSGAARLTALEAELRAALAPTAAVVARSPGALELWYPVRLAFAADGTELLPAANTLLDLVAHLLRSYDGTAIVIAVYTDAIGSDDYNQRQSEARAAALVEALRARGVAPERLIARGLGKSAQLEAPNTPEGRDLNRRVQLVITPLSS
jgi:outer membrane protein OmpA-like peptidoglycan-associated protein